MKIESRATLENIQTRDAPNRRTARLPALADSAVFDAPIGRFSREVATGRSVTAATFAAQAR